MPEQRHKLLYGPSTSRFQAGLKQRSEGSQLVPSHVVRTSQLLVLGAFQVLVTGLEQLAVLITAYLINAFAQVLDYKKPVEGNLVTGISNGLVRSLDVGGPNVHANDVDTAELIFVKLLVETTETGGPTVFRDMNTGTGFLIGHHHRDVIVALVIGALIIAQPLRLHGIAARQAAPHHPLHNVVNYVPTQAQAFCQGADCRRPEPVDHKCFKQGCEATARLCPGHTSTVTTPCSLHSILGTSTTSQVFSWQVSR